MFHQNVVTFYKKNFLGFFIYGNLKGDLLDFLNSFTEVYWTFAVLISLNLLKFYFLLFFLELQSHLKQNCKLRLLWLSCSLSGYIKSFSDLTLKVSLWD